MTEAKQLTTLEDWQKYLAHMYCLLGADGHRKQFGYLVMGSNSMTMAAAAITAIRAIDLTKPVEN